MSIRKKGAKILFLLACFLLFYIAFESLYPKDLLLHHEKNLKAKRAWLNKYEVKSALNRRGIGESGSNASIAMHKKELYEKYGFNAALSDLISVNRSVPDIRPEMCKKKTYLSDLPKVAIIIIFCNERLSVLLRTVHSLLNRTPTELLQEIILVDDGSTWPDILEPLDDYLKANSPKELSKVSLLRLKKRSGLMVARMSGARKASKESKVFIFLDSHFEAMYNWLPPLLEPIALNPKACTIPTIDRIAYDTFAYTANAPWRGYFDWFLFFQMMPLEEEEQRKPAENFLDYVMMGGAMAISADFFWYLGGFDEGMEFWGGEQYEISFKIWMCGGELISVPCSRLGHLFRDPDTKGNDNLYGDRTFELKNIRRLIDVWLDEEHREYVIKHRPKIGQVNPGNLSERLALRERLICKSFSWMLEHKMPNLKKVFPPVEPEDLGLSPIRSLLQPELCMNVDRKMKLSLRPCEYSSGGNLQIEQSFFFTWRCEIRVHGRGGSDCLESDISNRRVTPFDCHRTGGNQKWFYDSEKQWIIQTEYGVCMFANVKDNQVGLTSCDANNLSIKWLISDINHKLRNDCGSPTSKMN